MKHAPFSSTDFLLLLVVIIWGTVFPFGKIALQEFHPLTFAALRTIMAAPVLLLAVALRENGLFLTKKDVIPYALLGFLGQFINRICFSYGLNYTTASSASIIMGATPVFAAVFAFFLGIERITLFSAIGTFSAVVGVFFVIKGDMTFTSFNTMFLWGDLFIMGAAVSWALFTVCTKRVLNIYGILRTTAWSSAFGALFMVPFLFSALQQEPLFDYSLKAWLCVLYVSLLANALAHIFWLTGISNIGPTKTTIYQTLVPIVAIFLSQIMLSEPLLPAQTAGMLLILGGIYLTRLA